MMTFDTSTLCRRKNEISAVSLQAAAISSLFHYFSVSLSEMKTKWNDGLSPLVSKLDLLKQMLKDNGSASTIHADLFNLLVSGVGSPTIQQFLTNTLTEHPLRKLMKSTDTACTSVQDMLLQTAKPTSENVLYRFSQLHALSMWKDNFGDIGLKDTLIKETLDAAKELALKTDLLLQTVSSSRSLYESFFLWLLKAQRKMSNEPPPARKEESRPVDELVVAKFIKSGITADTVNTLLGNTDDEWEGLAEPTTPKTLADQYKKLQALTKTAFQDSPHTISLSFSLRTFLPVHYDQLDKHKYRSAFYCPKTEGPQYQYIALYCPEEQDKENTGYVVWIVRYEVARERHSYVFEVASIDVSPQSGTPIDLSFYNSESIAILRENTDGKAVVFELYEYSALNFVPIDFDSNNTSISRHLQDMLPSREVCEPSKQRTLQVQPEGAPTMAVGARGVGCVLQAKRRIQLLDLEEDEEEEEEESAGEEDNKENESKSEKSDISIDKSNEGDSEDDVEL